MTPRIAWALLAIVLLTAGYIDLELALAVGERRLNAPVCDVAALLLAPLGLRWAAAAPGPRGYAVLLLALLLSLFNSPDWSYSLHFLARKPLLVYLLYGLALAGIAARAPLRPLALLVLLAVLSAGSVSLLTSLSRIAAGQALDSVPLPGLTSNHKALAVSLAGFLPLLPALPLPPRWGRAALAVGGLALLLSFSRTAWLIAGVGAALWLSPPLLRRRPLLAAAALGLALAALYAAPLLLGSAVVADATVSRRALNARSWAMFAAHPLVGAGGGASVLLDLPPPLERVNGVDAHGALTKIGAEAGLLGLIGYLWFTLGCGLALLARLRAGPSPLRRGALAAWAALAAGLLLSTEVFSPTWWIPFGLAWGLSLREEPCGSS